MSHACSPLSEAAIVSQLTSPSSNLKDCRRAGRTLTKQSMRCQQLNNKA
jgi:hypothetical protein